MSGCWAQSLSSSAEATGRQMLPQDETTVVTGRAAETPAQPSDTPITISGCNAHLKDAVGDRRPVAESQHAASDVPLRKQARS